MISLAKEKKLLSLTTKKGREKHGLCIVEGEKVIKAAGNAVEMVFTEEDTLRWPEIVSTKTPQEKAAMARIPKWGLEDIKKKPTIVVLDGVQDPGNVGTILRSCLAFDASLILVESVDVTNTKVIRSSVGAMFSVPWIKISRQNAEKILTELDRKVYRLEVAKNSKPNYPEQKEPMILIAGSEGNGIKLDTKGTAYTIAHNPKLESLNVAQAITIALHDNYMI